MTEKDWADRIVEKVGKNVREAVVEYGARYLNYLRAGKPEPALDVAARTAIITVIETLLEDFPNLEYDEVMREMLEQIKERGNLE